ncbi:uncharacterized protein [Procambarus clarkii]|uniref:uncharacterized protein n=1 Tax=Procambarus clarkii TaxID=6728 RepID=UPI003742480F
MDSEEAGSAEEIKELMVMEKFMSVLPPEIRMRVKEADIKDLRAAADRADMLEEALRPRREGQNRPPAYVGNDRSYRRTDGWRTGTSSPKSHFSSWNTRGTKGVVEPIGENQAESSGTVTAGKETTSEAGKTQGVTVSGGSAKTSGGGWSPPRGRCYNCGIPGHVARECRRPKQRGHVALVMFEDQRAERVRDEPALSGEKQVHPFVCQGTVRMGVADPIPVKMLRDTGADFTLVSETLFPEGYESTSVGVARVATVGGPVRMPLHQVTLNSDYGCQTLEVGVCTSMPKMEAQVILGNDACGGYVLPHLVKGEECPEQHEETGEDLNACGDEKGIAPVAIPVCTVTPRQREEPGGCGSDGAEESIDSLGTDHLCVGPGGRAEGGSSPNEGKDSFLSMFADDAKNYEID